MKKNKHPQPDREILYLRDIRNINKARRNGCKGEFEALQQVGLPEQLLYKIGKEASLKRPVVSRFMVTGHWNGPV